MLGGLIGLITLGGLIGSGIKQASDNSYVKKHTYRHDIYGNTVWNNGKGETFVNGEKTHEVLKHDKYGHSHMYTVGNTSGKVYADSHDLILNRMRIEDQQRLEKARANGYLAYEKYNDALKMRLTTEISTGKPIAKLYTFKKNGKEYYRKFYLTNNLIDRYETPYWKTIPGDFGTPITKEEYRKLDIPSGSHRSGCGLDPYVLFNIGTEKDPYWKGGEK